MMFKKSENDLATFFDLNEVLTVGWDGSLEGWTYRCEVWNIDADCKDAKLYWILENGV